MTTNVQAEGPDPWAEIAAELHRIAFDVGTLIGEPAPSVFQINIQPKPHNEPAAITAVDIIAVALLGKPGETKRMSDGVYHRNADARRGPIELATYRRVPEPHDAELERLRARVAELEADRTGLAYTRADDDAEDPTPPGPREPLHTGGMTEGGLVDETEAQCPPECAQNWVRASDPLKHVDHCPKINETRTTLDNGCPEHGYRVTAGCSRCKQPVDKTPAEPVTVYKPAPASHPDWAKHVYGCGGGRQCRCDIAAGNAEPVDETGGYWDPSVTSVPAADYTAGGDL